MAAAVAGGVKLPMPAAGRAGLSATLPSRQFNAPKVAAKKALTEELFTPPSATGDAAPATPTSTPPPPPMPASTPPAKRPVPSKTAPAGVTPPLPASTPPPLPSTAAPSPPPSTDGADATAVTATTPPPAAAAGAAATPTSPVVAKKTPPPAPAKAPAVPGKLQSQTLKPSSKAEFKAEVASQAAATAAAATTTATTAGSSAAATSSTAPATVTPPPVTAKKQPPPAPAKTPVPALPTSTPPGPADPSAASSSASASSSTAASTSSTSTPITPHSKPLPAKRATIIPPAKAAATPTSSPPPPPPAAATTPAAAEPTAAAAAEPTPLVEDTTAAATAPATPTPATPTSTSTSTSATPAKVAPKRPVPPKTNNKPVPPKPLVSATPPVAATASSTAAATPPPTPSTAAPTSPAASTAPPPTPTGGPPPLPSSAAPALPTGAPPALPSGPPPTATPATPPPATPTPAATATTTTGDTAAPAAAKPLPPPPVQEDNSPEAKKAKTARIRTKVAIEIMTTEQTYVSAMVSLVEMYIKPLLELAKGEEKIVTEKQVGKLFSNIQLIATFNQKLLLDIEAKVNNWNNDETKLSDVFITLGPFFKMYTQYVGNHDVASETLNKLLRTNKLFMAFQAKCMADPRSTGIGSLSSFLIMPIQRIPRYKLLIQELHRNTDEKHPDFVGLSKALEDVSKVALHINEAIRSQQNRLNVLSIENQFSGKVELVGPSRRFVRQGPLTKKCRNSDKRYEFFLFNDVFLYASKSVGKYSLHQKIDINSSFVIQDLADKADDKRFNAFQVVNAKKSFIVYAEDVATKTEWIKALYSCIEERRKGIVGGSESAFVAPVWQGDKTSSTCVCCTKAFTLFNRRHHCRKCGSLVCESCSKKRMVIVGKGNNTAQRVCDKCVEQILVAQGKAPAPPLPKQSVVDEEKTPLDSAVEIDDDDEDDSAAPSSSSSSTSTPPSTSPPKTSSPSPLGMRSEARALYPYIAVEPTDLTFGEGDVITLLSKDPSGWWKGKFNGLTGVFPSNYVVEITSDSDVPTGGVPEVDIHVIVVTSATSSNEVELALVAGDKIHVTSQDTSGWYYGTNEASGAAGWFQSSNVVDASTVVEVAPAKAPPPAKGPKKATTASTSSSSSSTPSLSVSTSSGPPPLKTPPTPSASAGQSSAPPPAEPEASTPAATEAAATPTAAAAASPPSLLRAASSGTLLRSTPSKAPPAKAPAAASTLASPTAAKKPPPSVATAPPTSPTGAAGAGAGAGGPPPLPSSAPPTTPVADLTAYSKPLPRPSSAAPPTADTAATTPAPATPTAAAAAGAGAAGKAGHAFNAHAFKKQQCRDCGLPPSAH